MSAPQPLMSPGSILAGRWQIQDFIGNGETGEVYGVRDMHSTGTFALKLFWPNALGQAEHWSALQYTVRSASGLGVEGIARAYEFGIDANSARPFFVMERVSWSSLADRVRLRGPLTPADMATALDVIARALDAAHAAGIVHRDLKPENVFVAPENASWVRLSDFGVVHLRSASPPPPGWGGTVGWVGPDGADPQARSTPAMDIFALGLVTFYALTGGALHRAARTNPIDPGALWQELSTPLDSASVRARELGAALDPAFDAWFQRAVAPAPQARFNTATEMASAFVAIAKTLVAPQSQSAVALPGIAAAIAQPLVFQPESLPPPTPAPVYAPPPSPAVNYGAPVPARDAPLPTSPKKTKSAAPLFIGGAVFCFALTALGTVALYRNHESGAIAAASASAAAQASAALAAAAAAAPATPTAAATAAETASAVASATPPANAAAEPNAPATPAVAVASAKPVAVAALVAPKPAAAASAKPAAAASAKPVASAKTAPPVASAKPAASAKVATPAVSAKTPAPAAAKPAAAPKKKCGTTFLPCKG